MADDATLQARISELPPATKTNDSDQFEVTQGSPGVSRRVSLELLRDGVKPDLSRYLTGLVGGPGIGVAGGAPVPSVSLESLGGAGSWGDGLSIPQVTIDDYGRVISVVLVPIAATDLSGYAPLDSPAFTGQPTAPLAPLDDSSSLLSTTQWTQRELADYAPLDSPALSGTPTAPTQVEDTNDDSLATCAFVKHSVASGASITVGETPPPAPKPNQLWWHSAFGQLFIFYSDADSQQWVPASPSMSTSGGIPPGSGQDYFGGVVPAGWYLCDGALKDRVIDAPLFAAIGTTYGAGDGSTTFALPDCRGRVLAMLDYATGRLTEVADTLGAVGGADTVTLAANQMPSHGHGVNDGTHGHGVNDPCHSHQTLQGTYTPAVAARAAFGDGTNAQWTNGLVAGSGTGISIAASGANISIQAAGGGLAHPNTQPTMAVNKLIKR